MKAPPKRIYNSASVPQEECVFCKIVSGALPSYNVYEDDGHSFGYQRGEWMRIQTEWHDERRRLSLRLAAGSHMLPPTPRRIAIRVVPEARTREIVFAGSPMEIEL